MPLPLSRRTCAAVLSSAFAFSTAIPLAGQDLQRRPPHPPWVQRGPQVRVTALAVRAQIVDGVATTEVRQTFVNDGGADAEAEWILPLPNGAAPDKFTMTVNGKDTAGEVLDSGRARQVYEEIVRRRRDPGLLEYFGAGCLRARVFPIAPRGECQVVVRYRQVLPESGGVATWSFPLRATTAAGLPTERITVECGIETKVPLKTVYSPLPGVDVRRQGENQAKVCFEAQKGQVPERDFALFFGVSDQALGMSLLSTKRPNGDGYFLLLATPKQEAKEVRSQGRAITFVVDTSGSMQGKKIEQARDAVRFFVGSLRPADFFNVVTFATEAQPFFRGLQPATKESQEQAIQKLATIEAKGGTNIEDALRSALGSTITNVDGRALVPIVVFLTDGQPTIATTDTQQLLDKVREANGSKARVFVFGVGNDVNTQLLDKIAEGTRAERDYVREDESIEVKTGALFTKLSHPVLTDVSLRCEGLEVLEMAPKNLPDLFCGSRLAVLGRYVGSGAHAIRISGLVDGKRTEYVYEGSFASGPSSHDFVPALWANARVAQLLDGIRLGGAQKELVDEVQRLGREFQIVTPYTSHLVLEDTMRVSQAWGGGGGGRAASDHFVQDHDASRVVEELQRAGAVASEAKVEEVRERLKTGDAEAKDSARRLADLPSLQSGADAVKASLAVRAASAPAFRAQGFTDGGSSTAANLAARRIGERSFYLVDGVWVDGQVRAEQRGKAKKIAAFSDEYFALLAQKPDLAAVFAFSARIVVAVGDEVYEIG